MIRTIFRVGGLLVLILVLLGGVHGLDKQESEFYSDNKGVKVSFLSLKEDADCIFLQEGQHNVLIDTGEKEDAQDIVAYLKKNNVSDIQYLVLTHYDSDHIGGAEEVMDNFSVKNVIRPYYDRDKKEFKALTDKIKNKNIITIIPTTVRRFSAGDISLRIYPPLEKRYSNENDYSLVALASYGNTNMMFTGDAEKKRTDELMRFSWPKIDLYKVPHHGRANRNSGAFIKMLKPDYAVVTSEDADSDIKSACENERVKLFFSGLKTITFSSDGSKLLLETGDSR